MSFINRPRRSASSSPVAAILAGSAGIRWIKPSSTFWEMAPMATRLSPSRPPSVAWRSSALAISSSVISLTRISRSPKRNLTPMLSSSAAQFQSRGSVPGHRTWLPAKRFQSPGCKSRQLKGILSNRIHEPDSFRHSPAAGIHRTPIPVQRSMSKTAQRS